jgi:hypothetical protein
MDARQFDGKFGTAKAIVQWSGMDSSKIVYGAPDGTPDEKEGGLNLIVPEAYTDPVDNMAKVGIRYITVEPTCWVVKTDVGDIITLDDRQMRGIYPDFRG